MSQRAGWYDDPENPENLRYFDGVLWTSHTTPRTSPTAGQTTIGLAEQKAAQQVPTQEVPQAATQQLPYGSQQDSSPYGQPPQYGQQPPYGQLPPTPQYGPPGNPPPGDYSGMPPAYAAALGVKTTPDGVPLASYGQRVGAYLLDYLILGVVTLLASSYWLAQLFHWYMGFLDEIFREADQGTQPTFDQASMQGEIMGYIWPIAVVSIVIHLAYHTFFLMRSGATPGKMALGITVRLRDRPGPLRLVDALKRQVIEVAAGLLSFVATLSLFASLGVFLDLLWPLWDDKRQALHDKIAKTNVVVSRRGR